jgi:hypothetical protein
VAHLPAGTQVTVYLDKPGKCTWRAVWALRQVVPTHIYASPGTSIPAADSAPGTSAPRISPRERAMTAAKRGLVTFGRRGIFVVLSRNPSQRGGPEWRWLLPRGSDKLTKGR